MVASSTERATRDTQHSNRSHAAGWSLRLIAIYALRCLSGKHGAPRDRHSTIVSPVTPSQRDPRSFRLQIHCLAVSRKPNRAFNLSLFVGIQFASRCLPIRSCDGFLDWKIHRVSGHTMPAETLENTNASLTLFLISYVVICCS